MIAATEARPQRLRSSVSARTPTTWVRRGGLSTVVFALPLLVIFGVFSWWPIVRAVIMSFQETNLTDAPTWVGLDNFAAVLTDPLMPQAVRNTACFALLALVFGYPVPLIGAVLMSELRRRKGLYSVLAYLPVVVPPVVAVLLWKFFYDPRPEGVFNTVLGWVGLGPFPWLSDATLGDAVAGPRGHLGRGGRHGHHLPGRARQRPRRALRRRRGRRCRRLAQGVARDDAAAARRPAHHADPADHRDRSGVPRAVPVHRRRAGPRDRDVMLHVYNLAFASLGSNFGASDRPEPHARGRSSPSCRSSTSALRVLEQS